MTSYPILIADAGSTKVDWAFLTAPDSEALRFVTPGINALISPQEEIEIIFRSLSEKTGENEKIKHIFYYGAGCATPELCEKIRRSLLEVWPDANVTVDSDLVGAARSLLGHQKGIACILGTGSNSARFDGEKIDRNVPPMGYILGDEGSGTALGKRLLKAVFKVMMPSELRVAFFNETGLYLGKVLQKVYREPEANKFIASLVPFIRNHIDHTFIKNMVIEEFREFFRCNVALYPGSRRMRVCFTGSIAYHFEPQLRIAAEKEGFTIEKITKAPMEGLIDQIIKL